MKTWLKFDVDNMLEIMLNAEVVILLFREVMFFG
jgi:hypothetical protein